MSNMTAWRFRPRVGGFYVALGIIPMLAVVAAFGMGWRAVPLALVAVAVVVLLALSGLVLGTWYALREHDLYVRFAVFFRVTIPYADITSVRIVDSVQASSALDRRRVRIEWRDAAVPWERVCDVSPADRERFLALLKSRVSPQAWALTAAGRGV